MYLPIIIYFGVIVCVLVTGWIASFSGNETVAYVGCALAVSKILLDWLKDYQEKKAKAEEKEERVEAKLKYVKVRNDTLDILRLRVALFNPSHTTPLRIKSVVMQYKPGDNDPGFLHLVVNPRMVQAEQGFTYQTGDHAIDIEPRKSVTFGFLHQRITQQFLDHFAASPADKISIVIATHSADIARFDGKTILETMTDQSIGGNSI
jgi:hypothetical protein